MEHLDIIFKHNKELHTYECKITKECKKSKRNYHCLDNKDNDIHGFYIEVLNGERNRDLQ